MKCFESRVNYDDKVNQSSIFKMKAVKIKPGSFDDHIATNWMNMGLSVLKTLYRLNKHLCNNRRPEVG